MAWQDFPIFDAFDAEYGRERTLAEYCQWFEESNRSLRAVKESGDIEARLRLDRRKNCLKNFYEEAFPIETFLKSLVVEGVESVTMNPTNGSWDARLVTASGEIFFIETTTTLRKEFSISMAFLRKYGHSPVRFFSSAKKLWEIFEKSTELPEEVFQAYKVSEEISSQAKLATEAIKAKAINDYGRNTYLLVSLDNVDTELDLSEVAVEVKVPDQAKLKFLGIFLVRCCHPAIFRLS